MKQAQTKGRGTVPAGFLAWAEAEIAPPKIDWRTKLAKTRHKLFWLVEKNNNGPTGEVETFCDIACSAIRDRGGQ